MKLWKISQTVNNGYDTFDSCIVAAETEEDARNTTPHHRGWEKDRYTTWAYSPEQVTVEFIGIAAGTIEAGIILSSFNAG